MMKNKKAVTMIEVTIATIISALLIIGLMNIFSSGMRGSAKGLAHQANMETASILMAQIEYDLLRAYLIKSPDNKTRDDASSWEFKQEDSSGKPFSALVNYTKTPEGIVRNVVNLKDNNQISNTVFAKGFDVNLSFLHIKFNVSNEKRKRKRHGMWVELTVSSKEKKTGQIESFALKRLILTRHEE